MISLAFFKTKKFIFIITLLCFMVYSYKIYDTGYNVALSDASLEAYEAKSTYDKEISKLENYLSELEREYLAKELENKKIFEYKLSNTIKEVNSYVKDNGYTDCNIGTDGVRRVNDLLRGKTSSN